MLVHSLIIGVALFSQALLGPSTVQQRPIETIVQWKASGIQRTPRPNQAASLLTLAPPIDRCTFRRGIALFGSIAGGALAGYLLHTLTSSFLADPSDPDVKAERRKWMVAGAAVGVVIGIVQARNHRCRR
ncbi:MAG: hypothetical protein WD825_04660 [Gemmatimonadaceae bacterium]